MRYIGDVHGEVKKYLKLIEDCDASIQVGDMGIGFVKIPKVEGNHGWIRGNHDDPNMAAKHPNNIKDGTFWEDESMFFVGGAWSIDWEWRQSYEMMNGKKIWWPNEEVGVNEFQKIIDYYTLCKPEIMVTHDCPTIMAEQINSHHSWDKSKTRQALDVMFETWKPEVWIHGHHHINLTVDISGCRFFSLAELAVLDME